MKITLLAVCAALALCSASFAAEGRKAADDCRAQGEAARIVPEKLTLTQEWDKTFPKSDKVDHRKVTFVNRFGITLAADLYTPKGMTGRLPALAVAGAFGAVKEQISGRYAQIMAERGFAALAFDPSFTGESGGRSREDRHHRHLRLGRAGAQRCRHRHAHQGHRHDDDVRHEPRHRERLL